MELIVGFAKRFDKKSGENHTKTYTAVWHDLVVDSVDPRKLLNVRLHATNLPSVDRKWR